MPQLCPSNETVDGRYIELFSQTNAVTITTWCILACLLFLVYVPVGLRCDDSNLYTIRPFVLRVAVGVLLCRSTALFSVPSAFDFWRAVGVTHTCLRAPHADPAGATERTYAQGCGFSFRQNNNSYHRR